MPTNTTTYSFQKPVVGADEDSWGGYLNSNWDKVDDLFDGTVAITGIDINSGTIDNAVIGGTTPAAITGTTITGTSFVTTGDMSFGDNDKAIFGAGSDLQIFHNGTHSYIQDTGTGNLRIDGADIQLRDISTGNLYFFGQQSSGEARLYYSGSNKLATTSTGIDVTGTVTADGLTVDAGASDATITIDAGTAGVTSADAKLQLIGSFSGSGVAGYGNIYLDVPSGGKSDMYFQTAPSGGSGGQVNRLKLDGNGDISFYEDTGTTAKFFWDASLETLTLGGTEWPSSTISESNGRHMINYDGEPRLLLWDASAGAAGNEAHIMIGGKPVSSATQFSGATISAGVENGTDADGYLSISTTNAASTSVEHMRITSDGNVGIGTSSPATALDVVGTITSDGLTVVTGSASGTLASLKGSTGFGFVLSSSATAPYVQNIGVGGGEELEITSGGTRLALFQDGGDISFYEDTGTTAKFFWDASAESLGIGTSSPSNILHVSGTSGTPVLLERTNGAACTIAFKGNATTNNPYLGANGNDLYFNTGTAEAMRIDSSGNVGIGVTPSAWDTLPAIQVSTYGGLSAGGGYTRLSSNAYLSTYPNTWSRIATNTASLYEQVGGQHVWSTAASGSAGTAISFSESMRIDSSGNLLVGKTSLNTTVNGVELRGGGQLAVTKDGSWVGNFNRKTSDGDIVSFQKDGTTVGSIGTTSSNTYIGTGATGLRFYDAGSAYYPMRPDTVATRDNAIDLGVSFARFKDLYLSGGVYLGGTGSANHLDDYEEGTWTPTTEGDATGALSAASGKYVKIGTFVHIYCVFDVSTNFSSGNIGGLPFAVLPNSAISGVYGGGTAITSSTPQTFSFNDAERINFTANPNTINNVYRLSFSYITA